MGVRRLAVGVVAVVTIVPFGIAAPGAANAETAATFTTVGANSLVVPAGVTGLTVVATGGGGGAGNGNSGGGGAGSSGSSGSGGAGGSTGADGSDGSVTLTTVTPPTPVVQTPTNNCVASGTSSAYIPARGTKRLMKPGCVTNAGQRVGVRVISQLRGDVVTYRLFCKATGKTSTSVSKNASGSYCKKGSLYIKTYGDSLRLRVTWSAPATTGFAKYKQTKTYLT